MTIPRMLDLMGYWRSHPPIHLMIKDYLGIKGEEKSVRDVPVAERQNQLGDFISMFQGGAIHG